jgi:hypothetical protein
MDRNAMARAQRRRQALDVLEFERAREAELRDQLEETVAEIEGDRVDEAVFATMEPDDVEVVRSALIGGWPAEAGDEPTDEDELGFYDSAALADEDEGESLEAEITRLQEELDACRRRQGALERYLAALGG